MYAYLLVMACGAGDGDSGDSAEETTSDRNQPTGCDLVEVGYDGPNPPTVGDLWTVWPICDGAPVIGAAVIRVDPSSCVSQRENELTWAQAGTCEVMAQTGSQRAYLQVEVQAAAE